MANLHEQMMAKAKAEDARVAAELAAYEAKKAKEAKNASSTPKPDKNTCDTCNLYTSDICSTGRRGKAACDDYK